MASADYIAAAKKANREPTIFMKVEQADSNVEYYTSQSQWQGSTTLTRVDTTSSPGAILNRYDRTFTNGTAGNVLYQSITSAADVAAFTQTLSAVQLGVRFTANTEAEAQVPGDVTFTMSHRLKININGSITYSDTRNDALIPATSTGGVTVATVTATPTFNYNITPL